MKKQLLLVPPSVVGMTLVSLFGIGGVTHAAEGGLVLEEIIVSAQKRNENLQDVPVAVSAFTNETRDLIGISSIQDFTNFTPGVTYSTSTDRMNVRGVGRYTNNLSTSPGVATYGDGFYNYSNHQADTSALFTERVEILRGPQGTLYGRNSIGGAINVLMKRPTDDFRGEVRASAGNFEMRQAEGLFSGPLTDNLSFLIGGGQYRQEEGFVENIAGTDEEGERNEKFGLFELSYRAGDVADVWLKYEYRKWDNGWGSAAQITPYNTVSRCTPAAGATSCTPSLVASGALGPSALYNTSAGVTAGVPVQPLRPASPQYTTANPGVLNNRQVNHDTPQHETLAPSNQFTLESNFHLSGADLKYIGGYYNYSYTLLQDFDNSDRKSYTYTPANGLNPVEIQTQVVTTYKEAKQYFSNELNLSSTGDGALQWILGAYQYHEDYQQPLTVGTPAQAQLATPVNGPANPNRYYTSTDARINVESIAAFGQVDYSFTPQWKGTLGLRYTEDQKGGNEFLRYISWNPTAAGAAAQVLDASATVAAQLGGVRLADGSYTRHLQNDSHATTGTAGLEWRPTDAGLTYLKYTRGYKDAAISAGGFSAIPNANPEFINSYELGVKYEFSGRVQANASLFYYDYKDAQIPLTLLRPGLPNLAQTFNLDEKVAGAELETTFRATDALTMLVNYSYVDPEMTAGGCFSDVLDGSATSLGVVGPNRCANGVGHSVDGNRVPYQPKNKVAVNGLYRFDFAPGALTLSASWLWRDTQYASIFNRREYLLDAYAQTDFRATWQSAANTYSVVAFLRNAFDDSGFDGATAAATASGISQSFSLTPPRQYGMEFQYRFGK